MAMSAQPEFMIGDGNAPVSQRALAIAASPVLARFGLRLTKAGLSAFGP
jgi:hypothetical protein